MDYQMSPALQQASTPACTYCIPRRLYYIKYMKESINTV